MRMRSLAHEFRPYLEDGETVVWTGQPLPWRVFMPSDLLTIPFALVSLFIFLSLLLPHAGGNHSPAKPGALILLIFCIVSGLYGLVGRFVVEYFRLRATSYAITDRRVLILEGIDSRQLHGLVIRDMPTIMPQINSDGEGSLWFGAYPKGVFSLFIGSRSAPFVSGRTPAVPLGFRQLRDARSAYRYIESIRKSLTPPIPASSSAPAPAATPGQPALPPAITAVVRPYLDRGEVLCWVGQPNRYALFTPIDWFMIPFATVWCVLLTRVVVSVFTSDDIAARIVVPLFLVLGCYMLFGRFLLKYWRRSRTYYVVTDRRVAILNLQFGGKITSLPLATLPPVEEMFFRDGLGTLYFGTRLVREMSYEDSGLEFFDRNPILLYNRNIYPPAFYHIKRAVQVSALIRHLQEQLK